jgi:plastocyanin
MGDLFFPIGIGLILLAVAVSALGLRDESFPSSRRALLGVVALFVLVVAGTMTTAVINAKDEQQARDEENAAADAASGEEQKAQEAQQAANVGAPQSADASSKLDLSAPENGDLAFDPPSLEASAGKIEIDFTNPAPIEHDVNIERDGQQIAGSDLVSDGDSTTVSADVKAGDYTYYCSVPGHREAGMEGTLTVD